MTATLLAFPLLLTALLLPKFEEIKDFGVALPILTRGFIWIGRGLTTPLGWAAALLGIGVILTPTAILANRWRPAAAIAIAFAAAFALLYIGLLIFSIMVTMAPIIESTSKNGTP